MFDSYGSKLDDSNRTSVHVHLNVGEWHIPRLAAFVALYYIVEDVLTHWCGDHRVGNLFCLRAKDASALVTRVRNFLKSEDSSCFDGGMHYSGLNLLALQKHGSIEVRTMRGTQDPVLIKTWVALLERIYNLSAEYENDPTEIIQGFSGQPREEFFNRILGPYSARVAAECGLSTYLLNKSLHEGVRIAQRIVYCRKWNDYEKKVAEYDAFERNITTQPEPQPVGPQPSTTQYTVDLATHMSYEDIINEINA
jgi:hypothetical protein